MRSFYVWFLITLCGFILLPIFSCVDDEPIKLSTLDIQLVDSIFFDQKDSLIKLTDTLCDQQYPTLLAHAVDSVKAVRREEIKFILAK